MNNDHFHLSSSIIQAVDLNTMTVREVGELAEQHGLKLLDILTF